MSTHILQLSPEKFGSLFAQLVSPRKLAALAQQHRSSAAGAKPALSVFWLLAGLIFHLMQSCGLLSTHVRQVSGKEFSDSNLSERRQVLGFAMFQALLDLVLGSIAEANAQPRAFYKDFLLAGIDGTTLSVSNTPPIKASAKKKTRSRCGASAFLKLSMTAIYELGTHNPLAARIGMDGESEMELARLLLPMLRSNWLLIADRYYGLPKFICMLQAVSGNPQFLLRVRSNLKSKCLQTFRDGSRLVEIIDKTSRQHILLREIHASVRRRSGKWISVRLWTSLLDTAAHPAKELVALYGMRWEQECAFKELKINLRRLPLLLSHTLVTAAQEVACLVLAQTIIARLRLSVADKTIPVLQVSFIKTLHVFRSICELIPILDGLISSENWPLLIHRISVHLARQLSPPRRHRSCPRALRQPVSSWPRLRRNSSTTGAFQFKVTRNRS